MKWYCKYCDKEINESRKKHHVETKRHRTKAKWSKYFRESDKRIQPHLDDYKSGKITVDDFNEIEFQIYCELDAMDDGNYFENLADSDYDSEEDEVEDGERPILRRRSKVVTENKKTPYDEFKSAFDEWSDEEGEERDLF